MYIPGTAGPKLNEEGGNWLRRNSVTSALAFPRDTWFWKVSVRACAVYRASIHLAPAICQAPYSCQYSQRDGTGSQRPGGPSGPPGRWTGSQETVLTSRGSGSGIGAQPSGPEKGKAGCGQVDPGKPQRRAAGDRDLMVGTAGLPSSQADGRGRALQERRRDRGTVAREGA